MKLLGIDTTTKFLSLGLSDKDKIYEYTLELGRKHSALLVPAIKRVVEALAWEIRDIDYFACGLGPGSFTGMRVGVATIKGMSWAMNKPVIGISTLDILASEVKETQCCIVPVIDAKRKLIYCALYKKKRGALKRLSPYMLLTEEELLKKIKPNAILLGDALELYRDKIRARAKGVTFLDKDYWYPKAHALMRLAIERIREKKTSTAFNVRPLYLYPKECQIKNAKLKTQNSKF